MFKANGDKIGSEFQVNSFTRFNQESSKLDTFFNGDFLITWQSQSQNKSGKAVVGQYFNHFREKIGAEFQVNTNTRFDQESPAICSYLAGEAVIVWHSQAQDKSGKGVYAQKFAVNREKIGPEFQVNTNTRFDQSNPTIGCYSDGRFIVAWESQAQDGSGKGIFAQLFNADLTKNGVEFRVNSLTKNNQVNPKISMYVDNKFIVSWTSDIDQSLPSKAGSLI